MLLKKTLVKCNAQNVIIPFYNKQKIFVVSEMELLNLHTPAMKSNLHIKYSETVPKLLNVKLYYSKIKLILNIKFLHV